MSPTIPVHPWNPSGATPAARPNDPRYAHLFTRRPDNAVNTPRYTRPGSRDITGRQAYDLVAYLNSLGFSFSEPRIKGPNAEGIFIVAPPDGVLAVHYAKHGDPTPGDPDDSGANDLALIADAIGGSTYAPALAVIQLGKEVGLNPVTFAGLTDQAVVAALKGIFG